MINFSYLKNVFKSNFNINLDECQSGENWYAIKINDKHIQIGTEDDEFKMLVYYGQIDLTYEIDFIDNIITKVNEKDPIFGSILGLTNIDSYFVLELLEPCLDESSDEKAILDLINYIMFTAEDLAISSVINNYIEY